ncbi:DUF6009 family protein [Streptomyces sp. NPDC002187]|uniref:DUF6009 family protein n=1 Tax=Streptomyces sp. NPDC002187 TaxID=3364637 RepID=UPI0036964A6C
MAGRAAYGRPLEGPEGCTEPRTCLRGPEGAGTRGRHRVDRGHRAVRYVKQSVQLSVATRRGSVPWKENGRRVGYGVLQADAPSGDVPGKFIRRVSWVKNHDRPEQPNGLYKSTAPR